MSQMWRIIARQEVWHSHTQTHTHPFCLTTVYVQYDVYRMYTLYTYRFPFLLLFEYFHWNAVLSADHSEK